MFRGGKKILFFVYKQKGKERERCTCVYVFQKSCSKKDKKTVNAKEK